MHRLVPVIAVAALLLRPPMLLASGQGTPEEAQAMVAKAAEYLKSVGAEKAFSEFNARDGPWHDRDLYVTVADSHGVAMANGANQALVGKSVLDLKDPDGKPFLRETLAIKDSGAVSFRWLNPLSHAIELKTMYVVHVDDYTVGVGAYAR
jgi:cytochrome c